MQIKGLVIGVDRIKTDGNYKDKDGKASNFTLVSAVKRVDSAVEDVANKAKTISSLVERPLHMD